MIKVSVLYPNTADCRFDMDYYRGTHIPLVEEKLGAACKRMEVERGVAGAAPDSAPPYVSGVHMFFESLEA